MTQSRSTSATSQAVIERLARPLRLESLDPVPARFVYALRLIALHERVGRDPVPELAVRLRSVETAAKALALGQTISATWPENIHVSCFCSPILTHDEATIAALIDSAGHCDRHGFEAAVEGLVRPDRIHRLWEGVLALVAAEARTS